MANEPEQTTEADEADSTRLTHKATFVSGGTYVLGNRKFEKDKPSATQFVTTAEAEALKQAHHTETVSLADNTKKNNRVDKFAVEELTEEQAEKANANLRKTPKARRQRAE